MCDLPRHSRLLNGSDLAASAMNPLGPPVSQNTLPLPLPDLNTHDLSPYRHGTDKLTSCYTWPNFHIICGTHMSFVYTPLGV